MKEFDYTLKQCLFLSKVWVVNTTNYGWKIDNSNPMGAGVAKVISKCYDSLPMKYGEYCKQHFEETGDTLIPIKVFRPERIICAATKSLNVEAPWYSWKSDSDLKQITLSLHGIASFVRLQLPHRHAVVIPRMGCSNGNLDWEKQVKPLYEQILSKFNNVFILKDINKKTAHPLDPSLKKFI